MNPKKDNRLFTWSEQGEVWLVSSKERRVSSRKCRDKFYSEQHLSVVETGGQCQDKYETDRSIYFRHHV